ncbi:MAG: hypothetical protein M3O67_06000 [Bacteroidota bacterium]|nr:hypothetical protein [Bacteroidota bacterium]
MEQDQNTSLFGLSIDTTSKAHLAEAGRWARFIAIAGFILLAFMVIYGILITSMMSSSLSVMENQYGGYRNRGFGSAFGAAMIVVYVLGALIYFFPLLFTFRFSSYMKKALQANDQDALNDSFKNLKILLRFYGILMIIGLAFVAIGLLMSIVGAAAFS